MQWNVYRCGEKYYLHQPYHQQAQRALEEYAYHNDKGRGLIVLTFVYAVALVPLAFMDGWVWRVIPSFIWFFGVGIWLRFGRWPNFRRWERRGAIIEVPHKLRDQLRDEFKGNLPDSGAFACMEPKYRQALWELARGQLVFESNRMTVNQIAQELRRACARRP